MFSILTARLFILDRVLKRVFKNKHSGKERETCRTSSNRFRGWSAIWRKRFTTPNDGKAIVVWISMMTAWLVTYTFCTGSTRSHKLLPSLFSCFKKNKPTQQSLDRENGSRGGGRLLLRLMSSFFKKKNKPANSQRDLDEENKVT